MAAHRCGYTQVSAFSQSNMSATDRPAGQPVAALDASALMAPLQADVRLFEELDRLLGDCELVVPESVQSELHRLATGAGEEATAASVAADLADRACAVTTKESYADDALVVLAETDKADYIVTNDGPLQDRVLDRGVPVICLRGQNTLRITEP
jgi:SSU processome protein Utp24